VIKPIPASAAAASALALSQGVLTTMNLAQLKWIVLAILVTSLSAGGVIAFAYSAGQTARASGNRQEPAAMVAVSEGQLGLQSSNLGTTSQNVPANAVDGFRANIGLAPLSTNSSRITDLSNRSIRELEVELEMAINDDKRTNALSKSGSISFEERQKARGKDSLIKATLEGLAEDISDEIDRLKLESSKKDAELERAVAQREIGAVLIARNKRLNERKAGIVSEDEVVTAEAQFRASDAQVSIVRAEKAEVTLRIEQLKKRVGRIKDVMKLAGPTGQPKP
jgi:hypothetical protein